MIPADGLPDRQVWSRAHDGGANPAEFGTFTTPLVRQSDTLAVVGTRMAERLLRLMRNEKFPVVRPEAPHAAFADIPPEADEYLSFSAAYGEIGSVRAFLQLVRRADRSFVAEDDRRYEDDVVVDVLRPGLRYPARSDREFDLLVDRHLNAVRTTFRRCSVLLVALGGIEVCEAIADGTVVPTRPGDAGGIDAERYAFRTPSAAETTQDLGEAIKRLRVLNPGMAIILMISPEPPEATAASAHVVAASAYGKAALRVAMEEATWYPGVSYFPALEIAATLGAGAFGADGRSLSPKATNLIGAALLNACEGGSFKMIAPERPLPDDYESDDEDVAEPAATQAEDATDAAIFNFDDPNLTPEERRAARAAARAAEVAARSAARLAASRAASLGKERAAPPPPPTKVKRVTPTVVDSYTNTVPNRGKGVKAATAGARKPNANTAETLERRERRTARVTRRDERLQTLAEKSVSSAATDQPAVPDAGADGSPERSNTRPTPGKKRQGQRKQRAAVAPEQDAETQTEGSATKKARSRTKPRDERISKGRPRRAKASSDAAPDTSAE